MMRRYIARWIFVLIVLITPGLATGNSGTWPSPGLPIAFTGGGGGGDITFHSITTGVTTDSATTITTANNLAISSGDLVVCYTWASVGNPTVTCGGSNTLSLGKSVSISPGDPFYFQAYYKANSSANTGTCSAVWPSDAQWKSMSCVSYGGIATSSPLDQSSCNDATCSGISYESTQLTAQNVTTTQANELLLAASVMWDNNADFTQVSPYTFRGTDGTLFGLFDGVVTSTGTYPNQSFGTVAVMDEYLSIFTTWKKSP